MSSDDIRPADTSNLTTAEVVIPRRLDRILHYSIPERLQGRLLPGMRVIVPLGRFKITGYLIGFSEENRSGDLKEIIDLLDDRPIITDEILDLARWASGYFMQPLGLMVKAAIPGGNDIKSRQYFRLINQGISSCMNSSSIKGRILSILKKKGDWVSISELSKETGARIRDGRLPQILSRMRKTGILEEDIRVVGIRSSHHKRRKVASDIKEPANLPQLQGGELDLIKEIKKLINTGKYSPYLLAGINKAARERIYPYLISDCIDKGRGALLLVPEISPNMGLIKRLDGIFGGRISLFHSRISEGKRLDSFLKIRDGKIDIVVGTRSAIFAPINLLGIIIIEDEDNPSYKQDKGVRYNAKKIALKRGERLNTPIILGSSAPSVEGFYYGMTGVYRLRTLADNPTHANTADVRIVDMREAKGRSILSGHLKSSIADKIAKGGRVLLFVNKRGFSNSIICQDCGHYFKCSKCALSMTYHKGVRKLLCHYCNRSVDVPERCPECGSYRLTEVGFGTERVEEETKRIFSGVRIVRLDRDTVKKEEDKVEGGEIIIGTDKVIRGSGIHPFALIGIVSADTGLHLPDFRLSHKVYKLLRGLIELAGEGEVIIQTHNPYHHAIEAISDPANSRLDRFYIKEIEYRRELRYPPFSSMAIITIEGGNKERCFDRSLRLNEILHRYLGDGAEILGPAKGYPEMIKGRHRWQMILKSDGPIQDIIKRSIDQLDREVSLSDIRIDLDIDP